MAALLFAQYENARSAMRAAVEDRHTRLAERAAFLFEERLRELSLQTESVAGSLDEHGLADRAKLLQRLAELNLIAPHGFTTLSVVDLNGYTLAWVPSASAPSPDQTFADRNYFQQAISSQRNVIAGPILSRVLRTHVTIFASPIFGTGAKVVGVVVASVENVALSASAGLQDVAGGPLTRATVASDDGIIIAHRNLDLTGESIRTLGPMASLFTDESSQGRPTEALNSDGVPSLMYVTQIAGPTRPWRLVLETPLAQAFGPTALALRKEFLSLLLASLGVAPLLWLLVHWTLRPMRSLHEKVAALSGAAPLPLLNSSRYATSDERCLLDSLRRLARAKQRGTAAAEAESARLRTALHQVESGIIVVDSEARITAINHAAAQLLGWRVTDAVNRPLAQVYQPRLLCSDEPVPSLHPALLSAKTAIRRDTMLEVITRAGKTVPVSEAAAPVFLADGSTAGAVLLITDAVATNVPAEPGLLPRDETTGLHQVLELPFAVTALLGSCTKAAGHHALVTVNLADCGPDGPTLGQLRSAGRICREALRVGDHGFRWTESSLLLALKNCDLPEAVFIAEDLLSHLTASGPIPGARLSVGVLAFCGGFTTSTQLVEAALGLAEAASGRPGTVFISPDSHGTAMLDALGDLFGGAPVA